MGVTVNLYVSALISEILDWCRGKNWAARVPLLLYFVYVLIRHIESPLYSSMLGGLNLGIHELGHIVFGFFGQDLAIAGGTILQLLAPVFAFFNFYRQKDFFAMALSFGWLSTNFFNIAVYVGDARSLSLPLVSVFGQASVYHDWEYLLGRMNLLRYDTVIASGIRFLGVVSMLVCLAGGAWLLWQMACNTDKDIACGK